jgi:two-component sensor histidine kinase
VAQEVLLASNAAQAIAVILRELATNAAKYGPLSTPKGKVEVTWLRHWEAFRLPFFDDGCETIEWHGCAAFGSGFVSLAGERLDFFAHSGVLELDRVQLEGGSGAP